MNGILSFGCYRVGMNLRMVLASVFLIISLGITAQQELSSTNKKALKHYDKAQKRASERDFDSALALFAQALEQDPNFFEAYLRRGSLFQAMGMEDSVFSNLTKYLQLAPFPNPAVLNRMAGLSLERGEYATTSQYLNRLYAIVPEAKTDRELVLFEKSADFASAELAKNVKIEIEKLPEQINRFALQYLPTITIDNRSLFFTKRDRIDGDEDIVVSHSKDGIWQQAQSVSPQINSGLNEGACTISADGRTMIFTSCDRRGSFGSCDLYISRKTGENWSRPKNLGRPVNSQYWDSQPALSADGKTMIFSSNRPGGRGGRDLWISTFSDKKWSKPTNLGRSVNSFKDETTPFIHPDGETIFYSTNGFPGMGGFDLVKSQRVGNSWTSPTNLGYPINTYSDEVALLIASDGKTAYFAKETQRDGRITESKIVTFELPGALRAKPASYVVGRVFDQGKMTPIPAEIEVFDLAKDTLLYNVASDSLTGSYTMVLPPGKELACYVKKRGYLFFETNFTTRSNSVVEPDTVDIHLRPIAANETLVLKNIYFELDSYKLNSRSATELASIVEVMEENSGLVVEIIGHTDNSGSHGYNQSLSEKRAEEVYKHILDAGVQSDRVSFSGQGDRSPIAGNDTAEGRQSNRRIEFRVIRIIP